MINIALNEKEKKILEIAYLNFYCTTSKCKEHKQLSELRKLKTKSLMELDELIKHKQLEKLSSKYAQVRDDMKIKLSKSPFFSVYGPPLSRSDNSMNVNIVKRILLMDIEELERMPSSNSEVLEIQFFYCLHLLRQIVSKEPAKIEPAEIASKVPAKIEPAEIASWYTSYYPTIITYIGQKKSKKGRIIPRYGLIDEKDFKDRVIAKNDVKYFKSLYEKYKDTINTIHEFLHALFNYTQYFNNVNLKFVVASLMKVNVCPYCNRQYISILPAERRTTLTFDHYKREAPFPLLKLSLYNLIPSCYICNSLFKGISDLEHLYPWKEGNGGIRFTYTTEDDSTDYLKTYYSMNNCDNIIEAKIQIDTASCNTHAKNSIKVFKLKDVYQVHNHYASMLIAKAMKYEKGGYRNDIFKVLRNNNIITDETNLDEYLYGMDMQNKHADENSKNVPLFKLSSDILNEIKEST